MLDSWIRHLCLRCLWFLTMLENSVLGNKYQIFVSFSQGCGVFLFILKIKLLWNASTELEKTTTTVERHDPAVSPGCVSLSATGHKSLFFPFALLVEASAASIDCTRPATSHLPVITVSLFSCSHDSCAVSMAIRQLQPSSLSECIQKKKKMCVCVCKGAGRRDGIDDPSVCRLNFTY